MHTRSMTDLEKHTSDPLAHGIYVSSGATGRGTGYGDWPINAPNALLLNPAFIFKVHASKFPNGVTVTDCGFGISESSAGYTLTFKYAASPDGSLTTIESVATVGAALEAEDDGTMTNASVPAGSLVFLDISTTYVAFLNVWMTFTIA